MQRGEIYRASIPQLFNPFQNKSANIVKFANMRCLIRTKILCNWQNGLGYQKLSIRFLKICWGSALYRLNPSEPIPIKATASVTRLGDFLKFLVTNFIFKVTKIFGDFGGSFDKDHF